LAEIQVKKPVEVAWPTIGMANRLRPPDGPKTAEIQLKNVKSG
jgi:hypothetical protein